MDWLKVTLFVGLAAALIGLVCLGSVAWANSGSRNLALATGTVAAALLLFIIQLPFELRSSRNLDFVSTEFTIDRGVPSIRQSRYPSGVAWRPNAEDAAGKWLGKTTPAAFNADRDRLTSDFVLFSLIQYFVVQQHDWQLMRLVFRGSSAGPQTRTIPVSKPEDCTIISVADLRARLAAAGNVFAKAPLIGDDRELCFPRLTTVKVDHESLVLVNPFCQIEFVVVGSESVSYTKPGTDDEVPTIAGGEAQLETRLNNLRIETRYHCIRAQHRDVEKYKRWAKAVVDGVRDWFEGPLNPPV